MGSVVNLALVMMLFMALLRVRRALCAGWQPHPGSGAQRARRADGRDARTLQRLADFWAAEVFDAGQVARVHRQRGGVRGQNISQQVRRRPEDATRLVDPGVGQGMEL